MYVGQFWHFQKPNIYFWPIKGIRGLFAVKISFYKERFGRIGQIQSSNIFGSLDFQRFRSACKDLPYTINGLLTDIENRFDVPFDNTMKENAIKMAQATRKSCLMLWQCSPVIQERVYGCI